MSTHLFRRHICFLLFVLVSFAVFLAPFRQLIRFSMTYDYGSHVVLIAPASACLIFIKRSEIFSRARANLFAGSILFVVGIVLLGSVHRYTFARSYYLSLEVSAIVFLWISGFILCYGIEAFRKAHFALLFLALMVPIPDFLLDKIVLFLQEGSASMSSWLLGVLDVSVVKQGFVLRFPTLDLEVAKQCSGIRSSLALLITTLTVAEFVLHSAWRKALLLVSIVPVVILKNALRIVTISLLTIYVDRGFLHGPLHTSGGIVFYILGLAALVPVLILLKRSEHSGTPAVRTLHLTSAGKHGRHAEMTKGSI